MITEIMRKVAADLDKKDAAIAGGLGLVGGVGAGLVIGGNAPIDRNQIVYPKYVADLAGYTQPVHREDMSIFKHKDALVDRLLAKNSTRIKLQNDIDNYKKNFPADKMSAIDSDIAACKKKYLAALTNASSLQEKLKNASKFEDRMDLFVAVDNAKQKLFDADVAQKAAMERKVTLGNAYADGLKDLEAVLDNHTNLARQELCRLINDKADRSADWHNEHVIEPKNNLLRDAEHKRVADLNNKYFRSVCRKYGIISGLAAGVLLPSAYLAYRKFSNK